MDVVTYFSKLKGYGGNDKQNKLSKVKISISISISIIYLPSGTRGVVAQSPEPEAHDKSDCLKIHITKSKILKSKLLIITLNYLQMYI